MEGRSSRFSRYIRALVIAFFFLTAILPCAEELAAQPYDGNGLKQRVKSIKASIDETGRLISGDASDAALYMRRALLYQQLYKLTRSDEAGRIESYAEKGLADFSRTIELSPSSSAFAARAGFHNLIWEANEPPAGETKERVSLFLGSRNFEGARSDYLKAISLSPDDEHKSEYLGALSGLHRLRALRLSKPPEMLELRARGEAYSVWDDFNAAVEYAKKAAEYARGVENTSAKYHSGDVANLYENEGEAAYKLGEFDVALDAYREGEKYIPEDYHDVCTYYGGWGGNYAKKRMFDAAIEKFDAALKISEDNCAYLTEQRGDAYAAKGDLKNALSDYTFWMSRNSEATGIRGAVGIKRAGLYMKLGEADKALADLDYSIDKAYIVSCPQAYTLRARAYRRLGKIDLALADEQKARKLSNVSESPPLSTPCPEN